MKTELLNEQRRIYKSNFMLFKDSPQGTFQNNQETQYLRFERLMKNILPQSGRFSIHDIGSGVADLHKFLLTRNVEHEYSGTEIVEEMNDTAKAKYPYINLYNRDLLNEEVEDTYNFVALSGVFNMPGAVDDDHWREFCYLMIAKMFSMCTDGIVFNFLTTHNTFSAPNLTYFQPVELFRYCIQNLSRFVMLDHAYPLYEASITVFTQDYVQNRFTEDAFNKYLSR